MTILVLNHWWKISVWIVHSKNEPGWVLLPSGGMSWDLIIAIVIWRRKSLMLSLHVSLVSFIIYVQNTYYSYILECKQLQKYASNLPCIKHSCRLILNQKSKYLMFLNFRYTEQLICFRLLWYHSLTEGHFNTLHLEWQIQSEACSATLPMSCYYTDKHTELKRDLSSQDKGWDIPKKCLNCWLEYSKLFCHSTHLVDIQHVHIIVSEIKLLFKLLLPIRILVL